MSEAQPLRGISIPLIDGLGEVRVDLLKDGTVRITDRAADLPPYTLEFTREDWDAVVRSVQ